MKKLASLPLIAIAVLSLAPSSARAADGINFVSALKSLNLRLYGFVEADAIADTTQSFNEYPANALIANRITNGGKLNFAGLNHRTQLSARDSRLGLSLTPPVTESGWAAEGVLEFDLFANDAATQQPGGGVGTQSENTFFDNAGLRVRQAYVSVTHGDFNLKMGQAWSLFGWQPYYLMEQAGIPISPGEPFGRIPQIRLTHTLKVIPDWTLESAVGAAKPAQMNSGDPEWQGGLRLASTQFKAPVLLSGASMMAGLSAAVSGVLAPVKTAVGSLTGQAVVFDLFVPILPSPDGKDRSNTLAWSGEFMTGTGIGGLEYPSLSFGVPGITAPAAATPQINTGTAVDTGIAGLNNGGNAELIRARAFHTHLAYFLPGGRWGLAAAYSQTEARNLDQFAVASANVALAPKIQFGVGSVFFDPVSYLRFAAEVSQERDTYNASSTGNNQAERYATNNRFLLASFFMF